MFLRAVAVVVLGIALIVRQHGRQLNVVAFQLCEGAWVGGETDG
jgi:hypothetical protein